MDGLGWRQRHAGVLKTKQKATPLSKLRDFGVIINKQINK